MIWDGHILDRRCYGDRVVLHVHGAGCVRVVSTGTWGPVCGRVGVSV